MKVKMSSQIEVILDKFREEMLKDGVKNIVERLKMIKHHLEIAEMYENLRKAMRKSKCCSDDVSKKIFDIRNALDNFWHDCITREEHNITVNPYYGSDKFK